MKLVSNTQVFNEVDRGNLHRCLRNLSAYCDEIVVYDDASTDDSVDVAKQYTDHVIESPTNDFLNEITHRNLMLEKALELGADYVMYLDADELMDRSATEGGMLRLCETGVSYEFEEVTLWRSEHWRRMDYLGSGWFTRLWKVHDGMKIPSARGLHKQPYPSGLKVKRSTHQVLHYGYSTQAAIERRWRERTRFGVSTGFRRKGIDERNMVLRQVPAGSFPPDAPQSGPSARPRPIRYATDVMKGAGL